METLSAIGAIISQDVSMPLGMLWLMFTIIAVLMFFLWSALKGWHSALDMVAEWRQRYDAVIDVFLWRTCPDIPGEETKDDKRKKQ